MLLLLLAALVCALPASASAKSGCGAQPPRDNSELDQYSETIPGPCGDETFNPSAGSGGGAGGGVGAGDAQGAGGGAGAAGGIPASTLKQMRTKGADGRAAADLAEATAQQGSGAGGAENTSVSSDADEGMGIVLPLLLGGTLLAGLLYFLMRRRAGLAS
jgi:hypothetical protein